MTWKCILPWATFYLLYNHSFFLYNFHLSLIKNANFLFGCDWLFLTPLTKQLPHLPSRKIWKPSISHFLGLWRSLYKGNVAINSGHCHPWYTHVWIQSFVCYRQTQREWAQEKLILCLEVSGLWVLEWLLAGCRFGGLWNIQLHLLPNLPKACLG